MRDESSPFKGHPIKLKAADKLFIGGKESIKIHYRDDNTLFSYPLTFKIKSSNMHYNKDKNGFIDSKQEYLVYYSNEKDIYNEYNLYAGGKYILVPQNIKEDNAKNRNYLYYSVLFLATSLIKYSLGN